MIHLVSFADHRMTISAANLQQSATRYGVDKVRVYSPADFTPQFKSMAAECLKVSKGAGLYVWKPWVVWDYIQSLPDGAIVIYADAGQTFVDNVNTVIREMKEDIMFFSNGWLQVDWCKMSVMETIIPASQYGMGDGFSSGWLRDSAATRHKQVQASLVFFRLTPDVRNLITEWMLWALMPGFCDNSPSTIPNYPTFKETRWDQSILCCLQIKHGYKLHWFPTTTAYHIKEFYPGDTYPAIVEHHRKRNTGMSDGDSEW